MTGLTCVNVKDFGAVGNLVAQPSSDDTIAIQAAIDAAVQSEYGAKVWFPAGQYRITDTLKIHSPQHTVFDLQLQGEVGRSGTKIIQQGGDIPVVSITSDVWNVVGVQMRDLSLNEGSVGLYMKNVGYCDFDNLTFQNCTEYGMVAEHCGFCNFNHCWWVHLVGNAFKVQNGNIAFNGCVFGEDTGSLECKGTVIINSSTIYDVNSKIHPNGLMNMGRAAIEVHGDAGSLLLNGCHIEINGNLLNFDGALEVQVANSKIKSGQGPLISMNEQYRRYPMNFINNMVFIRHNIPMYASHSNGDHINIRISDNSFIIPPRVSFASSLRDIPEFGNIVDRNNIQICG